jgi:hypothetical protein
LGLPHVLRAPRPTVVLQRLQPLRIIPLPPPVERFATEVKVPAGLGHVAPMLPKIVHPAEPTTGFGGQLGGDAETPGPGQDCFLNVHGVRVAPTDRFEAVFVPRHPYSRCLASI